MFSRYEFRQDVENESKYDGSIKILEITDFSIHDKTETEFIADIVFVSNLYEKSEKVRPSYQKALSYCSEKYINAKVLYCGNSDETREIRHYPIDVKMLSPNAIIRFCALSQSYNIFDYIDKSQAIQTEAEQKNAEKLVSKLKNDFRISFANGALSKLSIINKEM